MAFVGAGLLAVLSVAAALAAPGDLDPAFGNGGKWTKTGVVDVTGASGRDMALAPDGSVMVVGSYGDGDWLFSLVAPDGSREIDVLRDPFGNSDTLSAVARQADGKFVAAGHTYGSAGNTPTMAVLRVSAPGVFLDKSFGESGRVFLGSGQANDVLVQPDGKIVVVGTSGAVAAGDIVVTRLNANGSLDANFDGDGVVRIDLGGGESASAVARQADGKLVVGGSRGQNVLVMRLRPDGSLDPGFDGDGAREIDLGGNDFAGGVVVQPDGKIVVAGGGANKVAVLRLSSDGSLDPSFAGDGSLSVDAGGSGSASDVALLPSGKLIMAGSTGGLGGDMMLVQVTTDGKVDASFDFDGIKKISFANEDLGWSVGVLPDGAIVVAGEAQSGSYRRVAVARVLGEAPPATPDPSPSPAPAPTPAPGPAPAKPLCSGRVATIVGTPGDDRLQGTAGDDVIVARAGRDVISALGGNDTICAGDGPDGVRAGAGADRVLGQGGPDELLGGPGADALDGGAGADVLRGGAGQDSCVGGAGSDSGFECEKGKL